MGFRWIVWLSSNTAIRMGISDFQNHDGSVEREIKKPINGIGVFVIYLLFFPSVIALSYLDVSVYSVQMCRHTKFFIDSSVHASNGLGTAPCASIFDFPSNIGTAIEHRKKGCNRQ